MNAKRRTTATARHRHARQRGMSMTAVMAIMGVAAFVGLFAFKVGPAYFENMTINKIVADKSLDDTLKNAPRSKIYASIDQAYRMNNLWDMAAKDTVKVIKDGKRGQVLTVAYEKRTNLFGNIDVVTVFEKEATP